MVIIQSMFWVCRVILLTCSLSHTCVCSSYFKGVYESAVRCVCEVIIELCQSGLSELMTRVLNEFIDM